MNTKTNVTAVAVVAALLDALLLTIGYLGYPVPAELHAALSTSIVPIVLYFLPENFPR